MEIQPEKQDIDPTFSTTVYFIDFCQRDYKWTGEPHAFELSRSVYHDRRLLGYHTATFSRNDGQSFRRVPMIAIRQIHEHLADVIPVPPELRNRKTEVIFLAIDGPAADAADTDREKSFPDVSNETPTVFFGSLPDFPEREAQGEFESRLELH